MAKKKNKRNNRNTNKSIKEVAQKDDKVVDISEKTVAGQRVTKEAPAKDAEKYVEDNLELKRMSKKERRAAKRERFRRNTEGMSKKERTSYFLYYYKWQLIGIVAILALATYIPIQIYKNTRPVALSYAVINVSSDKVNSDFEDEYRQMYDMEKGYQIRSDFTTTLSFKGYELEASDAYSANYMKFPTLCYDNYYDVIISNMAGIEYSGSCGIIRPVSSSFSSETIELVKARLGESAIVEVADEDGKPVQYAINISHTEFAKNLETGYDDVYLAVAGISETNKTNAEKLIKFILAVQ